MPGAHPPTTVVGNKIPFDSDLYWNAMCGVIGRRPDRASGAALSGYYAWFYQPVDADEAEKMEYDFLPQLKKFLDNFDIIFSETECKFGTDEVYESNRIPVLVVRVKRHVPKRT